MSRRRADRLGQSANEQRQIGLSISSRCVRFRTEFFDQVSGTLPCRLFYSCGVSLARNTAMRPSTLERAFELAASGKFVSVEEIRRRLSDEGYFTGAVCGPLLCRQLVSIMAKGRLAYVAGDHCRVAPHSRQESLDS